MDRSHGTPIECSRNGYHAPVRRQAPQRPKLSPDLLAVLYSAAHLPANEPLRIAAGTALRSVANDDTHALAKFLGASVRSVHGWDRATARRSRVTAWTEPSGRPSRFESPVAPRVHRVMPNPNACPACERSFRTPRSLAQHVRDTGHAGAAAMRRRRKQLKGAPPVQMVRARRPKQNEGLSGMSGSSWPAAHYEALRHGFRQVGYVLDPHGGRRDAEIAARIRASHGGVAAFNG